MLEKSLRRDIRAICDKFMTYRWRKVAITDEERQCLYNTSARTLLQIVEVKKKLQSSVLVQFLFSLGALLLLCLAGSLTNYLLIKSTEITRRCVLKACCADVAMTLSRFFMCVSSSLF